MSIARFLSGAVLVTVSCFAITANAQCSSCGGGSPVFAQSYAPMQSYAPAQNYVANSYPTQTYAAPVQAYSAPVQSYAAPVQSYAAPVQSYTVQSAPINSGCSSCSGASSYAPVSYAAPVQSYVPQPVATQVYSAPIQSSPCNSCANSRTRLRDISFARPVPVNNCNTCGTNTVRRVTPVQTIRTARIIRPTRSSCCNPCVR